LGTWCLAISLSAAEPKVGDPDVPEPFDASLAGALLEHPPFTRALNLSESLLLTGVAYVDGKPVATVKDVKTNQSYLVSDEPNAMGWRLAESSPSMRLDRAEVKIMIGTEIVPVRYSETQMVPQKRSGGSSGSSGSGYNPSRPPTPEEFTGRDEKGAYVRGMPYLNDADREKFRNGISREAREKFLNVVHDNREKMFRASHEERAGFVKKVFDAVTR
jgi:hypothetical protein